MRYVCVQVQYAHMSAYIDRDDHADIACMYVYANSHIYTAMQVCVCHAYIHVAMIQDVYVHTQHDIWY